MTKSFGNALKFGCLSLSLSMHRMLSVGNLRWNIAILHSVLILFNLEKTFLMSSCCSNHHAKK